MMTPTPMVVYRGQLPEGEVEDHGPGDIRAFIGVGEKRRALGSYPDRQSAMRAVSQVAKAEAKT